MSFHASFSSARETVEELKRLKRRIKEFVEVQKETRGMTNGVARVFEEYVGFFGDVLRSDTSENPQRRQIGFGGTLVVFAKKHEVSD